MRHQKHEFLSRFSRQDVEFMCKPRPDLNVVAQQRSHITIACNLVTIECIFKVCPVQLLASFSQLLAVFRAFRILPLSSALCDVCQRNRLKKFRPSASARKWRWKWSVPWRSSTSRAGRTEIRCWRSCSRSSPRRWSSWGRTLTPQRNTSIGCGSKMVDGLSESGQSLVGGYPDP